MNINSIFSSYGVRGRLFIHGTRNQNSTRSLPQMRHGCRFIVPLTLEWVSMCAFHLLPKNSTLSPDARMLSSPLRRTDAENTFSTHCFSSKSECREYLRMASANSKSSNKKHSKTECPLVTLAQWNTMGLDTVVAKSKTMSFDLKWLLLRLLLTFDYFFAWFCGWQSCMPQWSWCCRMLNTTALKIVQIF